MVDRIAKSLFVLSIVLILSGSGYIYGVISSRYGLFPINILRRIYYDQKELLAPSDQILDQEVPFQNPHVETFHPDLVAPGLLLIVGSIKGSRDCFIRVIDRNGAVLHEWTPRWTEIWGDDSGKFPAGRRPRGDNGMYIHGIDILPDGGLVANFEHLSTFRMNACGEVMWKLDNLGHHSVVYSDQGYLWVTAERFVPRGEETGYRNHEAELRSWKLQKISLDGDILEEIEMIDVLRQNDLYGLLFLSTQNDLETTVKGDTLHLNDVDEFPTGMESSMFEPGDLLVSLRNINTILVFDPDSLKVKFLSVGRFLRQHDPDFLPGDRISVFDNRNLSPSTGPELLSSRIMEINAVDGKASVLLQGEGDRRFFSAITGVHEHLKNGNQLVTSGGEGRVIEFAPDGAVVWRYNNRISAHKNARVFMAMMLPENMDREFWANISRSCN